MKLDEANAVLRPRIAWEAIDLGCALVRRQWGKIMAGWLTVALPVWTLIALFCRDNPWLFSFVVWWTKPILTRQPVYFLSRSLFGTPPRIREFWRDWKSSLLRGLLPSLTWRRLSFQRSFRLPVIMLEGQTGDGYSKRATVLSAHGGGTASALAFAALKLELVTWVGFIALLNGFLTEGFAEWMQAGESIMEVVPGWFIWLTNVVYLVAIMVIEPFYGGAGFALYINSRTHLEGWDIEVAFKRLTNRLTAGMSAAGAAMLALLFLFLPAAQAQPVRWDPQQSAEQIKEVLKDEAFELQKRKVMKEKEPELEKENEAELTPSASLGAGGLSGLGYAIIIAAVAVVIFLIAKHWSQLRSAPRTSPERTGPRVVMGMDVAPESLPDDIPQAAWKLYEAGRHLEALRLLYRGSLAWLIDRAALPVHESDTEGDCLRHTMALPDKPRAAFFENLTGAWIMCAYAGAVPPPAPMRQICDAWPFSLRQHMQAPAAAGTAAVAGMLAFLSLLTLPGCSGGRKDTTEWEEKIAGYKGEARINPWLAAEKFLTKQGYSAEVRPTLGVMPAPGAALFLPLDSVTSRGSAQQVIEWAQNGGHLIVLCSGTDRFRNDYGDFRTTAPGEHEPLLQILNVTAGSSLSDHQEKLEFTDDSSINFSAHDSPRLDVSRTAGTTTYSEPGNRPRRRTYFSYYSKIEEPDLVLGTETSALLASFETGEGRITLVASANPFRNKWIGEADNAAMLQYLISMERAGHAVFVSAGRTNLWSMLVQHAWMPLIAAILLIALWLWRHLPRFGRPQPAPDGNLRHFGSQLDEAGMFLEAKGSAGHLLAAARQAVIKAAARRGLSNQARDFEDQLASRTGIPAGEITTALNSNSPQHLIPAAATLQKLQQALGDKS